MISLHYLHRIGGESLKKVFILFIASLSLITIWSSPITVDASEGSTVSIQPLSGPYSTRISRGFPTKTTNYPKSSLYISGYEHSGSLYRGTLTRDSNVTYDPDANLYFATYSGTLYRYVL